MNHMNLYNAPMDEIIVVAVGINLWYVVSFNATALKHWMINLFT